MSYNPLVGIPASGGSRAANDARIGKWDSSGNYHQPLIQTIDQTTGQPRAFTEEEMNAGGGRFYGPVVQMGSYGGFGYGGGYGGSHGGHHGGYGGGYGGYSQPRPARIGGIGEAPDAMTSGDYTASHGGLSRSHGKLGGLSSLYASNRTDPVTGMRFNPSSNDIMQQQAALQQRGDFQGLDAFNKMQQAKAIGTPGAMAAALGDMNAIRQQRGYLSGLLSRGPLAQSTDEDDGMTEDQWNDYLYGPRSSGKTEGRGDKDDASFSAYGLPAMAEGGTVKVKPYIVNEEGEEGFKPKGSDNIMKIKGPQQVFIPPTDGSIIPHKKLRQMAEKVEIEKPEHRVGGGAVKDAMKSKALAPSGTISYEIGALLGMSKAQVDAANAAAALKAGSNSKIEAESGMEKTTSPSGKTHYRPLDEASQFSRLQDQQNAARIVSETPGIDPDIAAMADEYSPPDVERPLPRKVEEEYPEIGWLSQLRNMAMQYMPPAPVVTQPTPIKAPTDADLLAQGLRMQREGVVQEGPGMKQYANGSGMATIPKGSTLFTGGEYGNINAPEDMRVVYDRNGNIVGHSGPPIGLVNPQSAVATRMPNLPGMNEQESGRSRAVTEGRRQAAEDEADELQEKNSPAELRRKAAKMGLA